MLKNTEGRRVYSPRVINEIREIYGFQFSKSLGQNFLIDKNIVDKIIEGSLVGDEDLVIEIGPGMGVITELLAQRAKKVIAIEIDKRLIPILKDFFALSNNVEIINGDILDIDLNEIIDREREMNNYKSVRVVGNLPYYITTPIIMKLLEDGAKVDSITVMMQKEVADRLKAPPGGKDRGAITVAVEYYCEIHKICMAPKEAFMPSPKVDSQVIRMDVLEEKPVKDLDEKLLFRTIKAGFGQRRKTLLNSLSSGLSLGKEYITEILIDADIDMKRRAETLSIEEFARISRALEIKNK